MKKFIFILFLTLLIGVVPTLLTGSSVEGLILPTFYPPKILFSIVWSILYILMSISICLASDKDDNTYILYFINVILNGLWTLIFFGLRLRLLAFIVLILLFIVVLIMSVKYYKYNKVSTYLLIPYLIWLIIAGYLNISIYLLNL